MEEFTAKQLFDLSHTIAADLFCGVQYPWQILDRLAAFLSNLGRSLPKSEFLLLRENVWVARDASVAPSAQILGPCIVDHGAEIRHGALIRGSAMIGKNAVVGNSTEIKNSVLFDRAQAPHFNYVGDSVLGVRAHLGAGAVTSNVKSDGSSVSIRYPGGKLDTGRRKCGAMIGDFAEIGCNSVLCPGTVIGRDTTVYPLSRVRGYIPGSRIFKSADNIVEKMKSKQEE